MITELTLRLHGIPEAVAVGRAAFSDLEGAVQTAIEAIQMGLRPVRLELLDAVQVAASNAYSGLDLPLQPHLLLEFHGTPAAVTEQADLARQAAERHGGSGWESTSDSAQRRRIWKIRHEAYYAARAQRPGGRGMVADVCVPISRLAECITQTRDDLDASGVQAPIMGHVGDGNFHVVLLFDPDDAAELAQVRAVHERLVRRALAVGGTCTGEHGIGYGKLPYLMEERGEAFVTAMRAIKHALDPWGILNPGKVIPEG